jgi:cellulose synthase/poly-beta-1,6-N-acetylglucosamine synthase-like glycosyltransferase
MWDWILLVIFLVFSTAGVIQFFYYYFFYLSVYLYKKPVKNQAEKPVSVIICARNEAENLKEFLPVVLEQDYPDYEVIVVNDCSEDSSYNVLGKFLGKYPHLRVSTINKDPKFTHNKKFAQFIGIKAAKNEILLFTDADCKPQSNKWLAAMVSNYDDKTSYVLGYGGYIKAKGLLNAYIRYDTFFIAMQYIGMTIKGIPYMAVGRNLSYRRSEFFRNKGFGAHAHLASGDDDLFINMNAKGSNTTVEFSKESHTRSVPCTTAEEWITQKQRHLTTAPYYKMRDKFLLILEPASRVLFYMTFIALLISWHYWIEALAIFGFRFITQIVTFTTASKKLDEPGLVAYSLIFDIFSPLINSVVFLASKTKGSRNNEWR